ncbi:MAG: Tm-1-like ATP-binding domain-containing protein, partial [Bacteroidota bacterium]
EVHAVIGLGGTQGTSTCCEIMQALPYGFPKIMVSTIASGDTSGFVGIKDITMMFSVSDILKLNPFTRKILANAAAAACGMATVETKFEMEKGAKPLIGMSNLGVLTQGSMEAIRYIESKGYEVIVFHAVGSGGQAMEQMMKEGIIGAVFDYAMGEIADDVWKVLRAGGPERLTVAGKLGLPQVLCPGGAEHLGILVPPNVVPDEYKNHKYVFHSPVVFVPRLNVEEIQRVAADICQRLQHTKDKAYFMIPRGGVGRYSKADGVLYDKESDDAFFSYLKAHLPDNIEVLDRPHYAEDPAFVHEAVDRLIELIEAR